MKQNIVFALSFVVILLILNFAGNITLTLQIRFDDHALVGSPRVIKMNNYSATRHQY